MRALLRLLACALAAVPVAAQHAHPHPAPPGASLPPEQAAFLATVRESLRGFEDQARALAAGFRPLGPDMPHMGQHWVHPGRAVSRDLDPSRPSMLTYLDVGGRAVLTGAAFTVPVGPGESPPAFPSPGAWHAHGGRLMDEAFGLAPHAAADDRRPRLAMLHAWTGVDNPDGVWAADNWALPFVRGGYAVPAAVPPAAGRAVALAVGYGPFFRQAVERAAAPTASERAAVDAVLSRHRARIRAVLDQTTAGAPPDADALAERWAALWADLEREAPRVAERCAGLFGDHGHTGTRAIRPASMR